MTQPFSVKIFLVDGDPAGIKTVEKTNWSGAGLVFPQTLFAEARKRPELQRTGVYILVGPGESVQLPKVYIGEGDPILPRLQQHESKKDWWTHAVAFTSKDQNLNKAHIQHLEARLVGLAASAKRCQLDNGNTPSIPSLSEADRADAERFLEDILLCLPILGYGFFERAPVAKTKTRRYLLTAKGLRAEGYESSEGFVVAKGSQVARNERPSIHGYLKELRAALIKEGVLQATGSFYTLTQDYTFASPSTAAGVVVGGAANGRELWKTKEGMTLKKVQEGTIADMQ
ncbi:MAG: GIY-YIG nuclease family protein [Flavobacteriales bacterium]|nr:GIY-YIG nuclease family protein [Flavobacteriales bacterium]